jgi:hypothetical protein
MSEIWLVQYLCPSRHALCATPYEQPTDQAEIEGKLLAEMHRLGFNPWCGICGSRDLHFEHGRMAVQDWDEALRRLQAVQADNIASRAVIDARKRDRN